MTSVKGRTIASRSPGDGPQDLKSRKGLSWDNTVLTLQTSEQRPRLRWWCSGKESTCQGRKHGFDPWVRKIPCRRKWQPALVFLPGKPHGQRSLGGYGLWGHKRVGHNLVTKQQQQRPRVKGDLAWWCLHSHLLCWWAAYFLVWPLMMSQEHTLHREQAEQVVRTLWGCVHTTSGQNATWDGICIEGWVWG